jgi:hypothetical protein
LGAGFERFDFCQRLWPRARPSTLISGGALRSWIWSPFRSTTSPSLSSRGIATATNVVRESGRG